MNKVQPMHDIESQERAILVSVEPEKEMQPYAREELIAVTVGGCRMTSVRA